MVFLIFYMLLQLLIFLSLYLKYRSPEDRSSGLASGGVKKEDDDLDHHLLTTANGDVAFLADKPVRLTKATP